MEKIINVLGLQIEPKICDRKVNFEKVEALLEKNLLWLKPDLVVLPEVFATGIFALNFVPEKQNSFPERFTISCRTGQKSITRIFWVVVL